MTCAHCPSDPRIEPDTAGKLVDESVDGTPIELCSYHLREYRRHGYDVVDERDQEQIEEHVDELFDELEGAIGDAVGTLRGEAGELEARDDVDDHLRDVIEGLRHRADELENTLEGETPYVE